MLIYFDKQCQKEVGESLMQFYLHLAAAEDKKANNTEV